MSNLNERLNALLKKSQVAIAKSKARDHRRFLATVTDYPFLSAEEAIQSLVDELCFSRDKAERFVYEQCSCEEVGRAFYRVLKQQGWKFEFLRIY